MINPVHLHSFFFRNEASMVQVLLQSYGIEYELRDAHMGDVLLHISAAGGGQKMYVAESDYQRAKQLLIDNGYLQPSETSTRGALDSTIAFFTARGSKGFMRRLMLVVIVFLAVALCSLLVAILGAHAV